MKWSNCYWRICLHVFSLIPAAPVLCQRRASSDSRQPLSPSLQSLSPAALFPHTHPCSLHVCIHVLVHPHLHECHLVVYCLPIMPLLDRRKDHAQQSMEPAGFSKKWKGPSPIHSDPMGGAENSNPAFSSWAILVYTAHYGMRMGAGSSATDEAGG